MLPGLVLAVVSSPESSPWSDRLVYGNSIDAPSRTEGDTAHPTETVGTVVVTLEWTLYEARRPVSGSLLATTDWSQCTGLTTANPRRTVSQSIRSRPNTMPRKLGMLSKFETGEACSNPLPPSTVSQ